MDELNIILSKRRGKRMSIAQFHLYKFYNRINETIDFRDPHITDKIHVGW